MQGIALALVFSFFVENMMVRSEIPLDSSENYVRKRKGQSPALQNTPQPPVQPPK